MSSWSVPTYDLPGTPEETLPQRICSSCNKPSNAHQGVFLPSGAFRCGRCYRRPIIAAAPKRK